MHFEVTISKDNTNHNAWTLAKHIAGSANKAAGNIDNVIYGTRMPPKPIKPKTFVDNVESTLIGILAIIAFGFWIWIWLGRYDAVKERIMR